ncbi:Hypothetical protein GbCGDNIH9_0153 [Granulibacter bethesdensis]|uniref:Uncharacterized protein n=1 Tax=Granulibacter bethesdensis TaxID=364410 RepID=A0AAC9P7F8_9PROT|nr:hypothetical protein [Granulibacter bethesdensis]APH53376.1 Hypothetical protein GbCGDNIH9_0153 [Granulibacter bethesdensis]APH60953.1 Hypothetical protein GbCGDNIH8_0153 [Granulibacter bethesdensis]
MSTMAWFLDARIPVDIRTAVMPTPVADGVAMLMEAGIAAENRPANTRIFQPAAPRDRRHGADCACCTLRSPLAEALSVLFLDRVRGQVDFNSVVVIMSSPEAAEQAIETLRNDPLLAARFRPVPPAEKQDGIEA